MTISFYPCKALNAGGAADATRYSLQRVIALAESLLAGVVEGSSPIVVTERAVGSEYLLELFKAMLPPASAGTGKVVGIKLRLANGEDRVTPIQSILDNLASLINVDAKYAVINGTSRTLALALIRACGLPAPAMATVIVEGTDDDLRAISVRANTVNDLAARMAYQSRVAYALSVTGADHRPLVTSEADLIRFTGVGRGIGQLMFRAAKGIRAHNIKCDGEGQYPALDKEGWGKVAALPADHAGVGQILKDSAKTPARTCAIKKLSLLALPAGPAGDAVRCIIADDLAGLVRLLQTVA